MPHPMRGAIWKRSSIISCRKETPYFQHADEGDDDMPSHIRMVLTQTSEVIPIANARMQLGTWQGIFLFEHRRAPHTRKIVVTVIGE